MSRPCSATCKPSSRHMASGNMSRRLACPSRTWTRRGTNFCKPRLRGRVLSTPRSDSACTYCETFPFPHKVFNHVSRIKDNLRHKFADLANNFEKRLRLMSSELVSIEGPLEEQIEQIRLLQARIPPFSETLEAVIAAEDECRAANVDENDYTAFTVEDLRFELELVTGSIAKKLAFTDNQVRLTTVTFTDILKMLVDCFTEHDQLDTSTTGAIREHVPVLRQGRVKHAQPI